MRKRGSLLVVPAAVVALALAHAVAADDLPPPPEVILPAPAVEAVSRPATPWMRNRLARLHGALRPARHVRTIVVARLRLALVQGNGHVWFVAYRSRGGGLCGVTFESQPGSWAMATGGLSCRPEMCGPLCLGGSIADPTAGWLAFSATAPASADGFRLTLSDGSKARFPLTGPTVPGARERRIVLAQLMIKTSITLAEALHGDEVIASQSFTRPWAVTETRDRHSNGRGTSFQG